MPRDPVYDIPVYVDAAGRFAVAKTREKEDKPFLFTMTTPLVVLSTKLTQDEARKLAADILNAIP